MRNTALCYFTIVLLLASCDKVQSPSDKMAPLYPAPQIVVLNTQEGYTVNPITGDSIKPLINSLGDTLKTGVPLQITGKVIDPSTLAKPKVIPVGRPEVVRAHLNVHEIKENPTFFTVNKDLLQSYKLGGDTSSFILLNSTGDTVPTGVPIPARGKVVPCKEPQPILALLPRRMDNAIIHANYIDVDQGLNSSFVWSMLEDSRGNLWFGTWVGGVSMYDGVSFRHFTQKEGLIGNTVNSILEDRSGDIWFGTEGGLSKYDGEFFTNFTENEGLGSNNIKSILEDNQGNLWIGTMGGGMSRYNGESFIHITKKEGLKSNNVHHIIEDSQDNLWIATSEGVSMYDGVSFVHFTKESGLSSNAIYSILEDGKGKLWFGTSSNGINLYNGETITHFTENDGLIDDRIRSLLKDSNGKIYIGTWGGLSIYDGNAFRNITKKEGLSNNIIWSSLEDSHGNLWFGTLSGACVYNNNSFTHITENEGLSSNYVRSILEDSHGRYWFGTFDGGINMYNGVTITHYTENEGLSNEIVRAIAEDSYGFLWFGTLGGGVVKYDGKTFTHFTKKEGLISNYVMSILEDSKGNLWFGSDGGGVGMYDGKRFTHFTENEGISSNFVNSIMEDRFGNICLATRDGGVSIYNGKTITHITEKEGLSNNNVFTIHEDKQGNLWFGTYGGGINIYNGETFTYITEREGLSNNLAKSFLEDNDGNIWIGTEKGLNRIALNKDKATSYFPVIQTYSILDGLRGIDLQHSSVFLDSKNQILWGSLKGLTILNMNNFKIPDKAPSVTLTRIDINENFTDYRHLENNAEINFSSVPGYYNYPLNLKLPYDRNHLTFHFSAIDWSAPHKLKYSYQMKGLDDKWSTPIAEAKADYRNMPHGIYTFKIRAIGAARQWSEPFEYTFSIAPPWWKTWWARACYGIVALLIVYGIVRWRTRNLKQNQTILEQKIEERTTEIQFHRNELLHQKEELQVTLENLKNAQSQLVQSEKMASIGQLVAGIAHEINNPVTFISAGVDSLNTNLEEVNQVLDIYHRITPDNAEEKLKEIEKLKEKIEYKETISEINKLIDSVRTGTERTTEIVKGLRTFSRLDEDVLKMADIREGIDSTLILLRNKYRERIEIDYQCSDIPEIECYPGQLNQVFMNILSNAIDAIDEKGTITISTLKTDGSIRVSIKDTGKGIPENIQQRIFEPFFTTKEVGHGTGLGLSICHSIIKKHSGTIEIKSEIGNGTEFVIILPVKQSI